MRSFFIAEYFVKNLLTTVNLFDIICRKDYTIYWFAMENCMCEFLFFLQVRYCVLYFNP